MTKGKNNDFQGGEGGEITGVRNRIQAKKAKNKIPSSNKQGQEESKME